MSYRSHSSSHGVSAWSRLSLRERRRVSRLVRRGHGLVWLLAALIGALFSGLPLRAGQDAPPPRTQTRQAPAPAPEKTPRPRYYKIPYLLVFEPMGVRTKSIAGPRFRNPPLLPARKESRDTASAGPNRNNTAGAGNEHKPESVLSSDPLAPAISVPKTSGASTTTSASSTTDPLPANPVDNALAPPKGQEPELKDAAIYFETPIGRRGASATVAIPQTSSPAQPQPASSATYQEKP